MAYWRTWAGGFVYKDYYLDATRIYLPVRFVRPHECVLFSLASYFIALREGPITTIYD
jgi:hypothetical protein